MANGSTYTVKAGDTLSLIARNVLGDVQRWPELARLNSLASPYTIRVGQVLKLPATVKPPVASVATPSSVRVAQSRLAVLQGQLTDLATQMRVALANGDTHNLESMRIRFRALSAEAAILRQQVNRSEMPSDFLRQLDAFADRVTATAAAIGEGVGSAARGIGATFRFLPVLVGVGVVVAVLIVVAQLRRRKGV